MTTTGPVKIFHKGKIIRFHYVCNNYVKACVLLEVSGETVYCLVRKVNGVPVFDKGEEVGYVLGPRRVYKGHAHTGEIAAWDDVAEATDEDLADAAEWGLK